MENNDTTAKRIVDKTLGQIKHHLIEKGYCNKDVNIMWEAGKVKVNKEVVATVTSEGTGSLTGRCPIMFRINFDSSLKHSQSLADGAR